MMCSKNCLHIGTFQLGSLQDLLWPHWINCRRISSFFINNPGSSIPKQESRKIQSLLRNPDKTQQQRIPQMARKLLVRTCTQSCNLKAKSSTPNGPRNPNSETCHNLEPFVLESSTSKLHTNTPDRVLNLKVQLVKYCNLKKELTNIKTHHYSPSLE